MAAKVFKLGPGTLKLGPTTTALDVSCQLTNAVLTPDKDTEDPVTVLCGDTIPGASTYQWKITGTALVDVSAGGMAQFTWTNQNKIVAFEFVPNTDAAASFSGELVVDPLAIGGDSGKNMTQDFEWSLVGSPTPTWPPAEAGRTFPAATTFASAATYPTRIEDAAPTVTPAKASASTSSAE